MQNQLSRLRSLYFALAFFFSLPGVQLSFAQEKSPPLAPAAKKEPTNPLSGKPAAPAPALQVQNTIKKLKGNTLGSYFTAPKESSVLSLDQSNLDPEQIKKFERELGEFLEASEKIGFVKKEEYLKWWQANKARLLSSAQMNQWKDMPLEVFVSMTWLEALVQSAKPADRNKVLQKVYDTVDNYWVQTLLGTGWAMGAFVLTQAWDSVRMAFTNGVVADAVRAYLEPVAKTVRELLAVVGAKHMAPVSVPFSQWGATRITAAQASSQSEELMEEAARLADSTTKLSEADQKVAQLKSQLDAVSFPGLSVEQMDHNMAKFNKQWVDAIQVWNTALPGNSQGGRNVTIDGVIFRPKDFMRDLAVFETKFELFRQSMRDDTGLLFETKKSLLDQAEKESTEKLQILALGSADGEEKSRRAAEIIAEKNKKIAALADWKTQVQADWKNLLAASEAFHEAELERKPIPNQVHMALRQKLIAQGLPAEALDEVLERHRGLLVSRQQMAASIAGQMYHDMMFPEFNRLMPKSVNEAFRVMQQNFGFTFFEKKLRPQIHKMLHQMGIEIGADLSKAQSELVKTTLQAAELRAIAHPKVEADPNLASNTTGRCSRFFHRLRL
jgi:hypothetical protein